MHVIPIIYDMSHIYIYIYGPLERGSVLYGERMEADSCSEVKEAVSTVIAQSARGCRVLQKNQCSFEPMANRCAPGVSSGDHILVVVLARGPSGTAWSHVLLNLDTVGPNQSNFFLKKHLEGLQKGVNLFV